MIQSWIFWALAAVSCLIFWALPLRLRAGFLTCVSIGYLLTLDVHSVVALFALTTLFYLGAPYLAPDRPQRQRLLTILILIVCFFLAAFKYIPPLLRNFTADMRIATLLIPLGISYYCFKLIHLGIEVSRGTVQRGRIDTFYLYLFWFPIFTAGPIERYDHFIANRAAQWRREDAVAGLHRVVVGIIKQAVIVDLIARFIYPSIPSATALVGNLDHTSTAAAWLVVLRTYLSVYVSFSAYTDIAIGLSRLFGIGIMENFNWPIFARTASEYWQRWHMTLSSWCQNYIYLPALGLTRNPYFALQVSFFVMGMWHAGTATRLLWGFYHACGVGAYTAWSRARRRRKWNFMERGAGVALAIVLTQLYVLGSWAILAGEETGSVRDGVRVLAKLLFVTI